jgi:SAM-dependent methyltransferase
VGVDLAEGMVGEARRAHPHLHFHVGDAEQLPVGDGSFDAAVGGFVLNHLPHPERCATECARVVRPGGGVAFAVWDRPERARLIGLLGEAIERAGGDRSAGVPDGPDDFRFADHDEMRELLRGAGLEHLRVETIELGIEVEDTDTLWDGLLGGLVRASTSVDAQPDHVRVRVRAAFEDLTTEFRRRGAEGLEVPTVVVLGSARRPARAR